MKRRNGGRGPRQQQKQEAPLTPALAAAVTEVLEAHRDTAGPLLPILHDLQDRLGHIPPETVPTIARALNLSRAEVHGTITFYHDFRQTPGGRHRLQLCQAEACQSMGARALAAEVSERLGCGLGETTADGAVTIEAVYCLGNCACSPAALLDGELHGRLTADRVTALVADAGSPA